LGLREVAQAHVQIVEQENNEPGGHTGRLMCLSGRRSRGWSDIGVRGGVGPSLKSESRNDLGLAVIEDLEIFFLETTYIPTLAITDNHGYQSNIHRAFDSKGAVPNWRLRRLLSRCK
jgi:hypothetical protein